MRRTMIFLVLAALILIPFLAEARVTELLITSVASPTFGGVSFGSVGQYERLSGIARGELDPNNPLNADVVNIDKAPRNVRGNVEYDVDVYILKPVDLTKGNGRIFYNVLNRGGKGGLLSAFNDASSGGNDPSLAADAGNGFLMRQGYTIVWIGWQTPYPVPKQSAGDGSRLATGLDPWLMMARFPIPTNPGGAPIVALSREEFIVDTTPPTPPPAPSSSFTGNLTYPVADPTPALASLTVREKQADPRQTPADMSWSYVDPWHVRITRPSSTAFDGGAIYEFIYPAKDPVVTGMAFPATRDVLSFLRYEALDDIGNTNPLAPGGTPGIEKVLGWGTSQSGRYIRNLIHEGFNQDEKGRKALDGITAHVGGSRKGDFNFAFSLSGTWSRQHEEHFQRNDQFPFTWTYLHDPISGLTDGMLVKCQASGTCPKIMETMSEDEMFQARASLLVTDTEGNDITLPDNVRVYLFASTQHAGSTPPSTNSGNYKYFSNPLRYTPLQRALLVALDRWVTYGERPPDSQFPRRKDHTLVPSDQASTGFPDIPGVVYTGLYNWLRLTDYTVQPPAEGPPYPVFVNRVDKDGNGLAGIRLPDVEVPLATYTGWNLRGAGHAENELCTGTIGAYFPFPQTKAERLATGDPRRSVEERYPTHESYVGKVRAAAQHLRAQALLLDEDVEDYIEAAEESSIGKPKK